MNAGEWLTGVLGFVGEAFQLGAFDDGHCGGTVLSVVDENLGR